MSDTPRRSEKSPTPVADRPERRQSARIEVLGRIHGHVVALHVPLTLVDMSLGGFSIKSTVAFPVGALHDFRFTAMNRAPVVLRARIVHGQRTSGADGADSYVTGLEFADRGKPEFVQTIASLFSLLKGVVEPAPRPSDDKA